MARKYSNREIADILREMSVCYEMEGVAFKPAAYERAADAIASLGETVGVIYGRGGTKELEKIDGVGPAIAEHIEELIKRGSFKEYARCRREMPDDVLELVAVPNLGPKKVKTLYEKLRVRTLDDLEKAAAEGRVRTIAGFGPKSEEKILKGIALLRRSGKRRLLGEVLPLARSLETKLNAAPGVTRAVMAGSIRRRRETIGDFDLVMTSAQPKKAMDAFAEFGEIKKILKRGRRNITALLKNGMTCDVIVVPDDVFGAALQHFTGDKDHNVIVRKLAGERGLKLNEYGLWRGDRRLAAKTEHDIYRALGLPYIEPELRTASGEVEAALEDRLPLLLPYGSVRGDLQVQTSWTDGTASIEEMARAALRGNLEYIAVTDHTRSLAMVGGLDANGLAEQGREIDRLNEALRKEGVKFTVLKGTEVNILKDGSLDVPDTALKKLDMVGAAIHANFNLPAREQTDRLIAAMKNPHVDIIFHPTGRIIGRREPLDLDMDRLLRAAKETGTALEINSYPDRSDLNAPLVRKAVDLGVRLAIDTDAHRPEHFRFLELGEAIARSGWAGKKDVINTKTAESLMSWLRKPKCERRKS